MQGARNAATETYLAGRRGSEYRATQQRAATAKFAGYSSLNGIARLFYLLKQGLEILRQR